MTTEEIKALFAQPAHIPTAEENNLQAQTYTAAEDITEVEPPEGFDPTDPIDMLEALPAAEVADLAVEVINMGITTFFPDMYARKVFTAAEIESLRKYAATGNGTQQDQVNNKVLQDYIDTMIPPEEKQAKIKQRMEKVIENMKFKISPEWALAITAAMAYAPAYLPLLKKPVHEAKNG